MSFQSPNNAFDARTARCVAHFNIHQPGWFRSINIATLHQGHDRYCAVAQLTKKKWKWLAPHLGLYEKEQHVDLGLYCDLPTEKQRIEYYWKQTLSFRRAIIALCAGTYVGVVQAPKDLAWAA